MSTYTFYALRYADPAPSDPGAPVVVVCERDDCCEGQVEIAACALVGLPSWEIERVILNLCAAAQARADEEALAYQAAEARRAEERGAAEAIATAADCLLDGLSGRAVLGDALYERVEHDTRIEVTVRVGQAGYALRRIGH